MEPSSIKIAGKGALSLRTSRMINVTTRKALDAVWPLTDLEETSSGLSTVSSDHQRRERNMRRNSRDIWSLLLDDC